MLLRLAAVILWSIGDLNTAINMLMRSVTIYQRTLVCRGSHVKRRPCLFSHPRPFLSELQPPSTLPHERNASCVLVRLTSQVPCLCTLRCLSVVYRRVLIARTWPRRLTSSPASCRARGHWKVGDCSLIECDRVASSTGGPCLHGCIPGGAPSVASFFYPLHRTTPGLIET